MPEIVVIGEVLTKLVQTYNGALPHMVYIEHRPRYLLQDMRCRCILAVFHFVQMADDVHFIVYIIDILYAHIA